MRSSPASLLRLTLSTEYFRLIENKYFETVVLALILMSSFVMTLEDVWFQTRPLLVDTLYYLDKILTVVFFLETCLKLVAMGIVAYFSNAWCWLDFIIVGVSIVNFVASILGKIIIKPQFSVLISSVMMQEPEILPSSRQ